MQVVGKQKGLNNGRGDQDIGIGYIHSAETYVKLALKKPRAGWRSNQNATRELKNRQKAESRRKNWFNETRKGKWQQNKTKIQLKSFKGAGKPQKRKRKRKTLPEGAKVEKNSKKPQLHIQKEKTRKTRDPRKQNWMGTHKSKTLQAPKIQCKVQVGNSKTQNPKQRGTSKTQKPKQKGVSDEKILGAEKKTRNYN